MRPSQQRGISLKAQARSVLIGGCVLLFFGIYVSAFLIPDVIRTAGGPTSYTVNEAANTVTGEVYATVEDGVWVCDSIDYLRTYSSASRRLTVSGTRAFHTDRDGEVAIWVRLSGELTCDDLQSTTPEGYLEPLPQSTRMDLAGDGQMRYVSTANTFFEMCGYCGTENSTIGAIFGVVFVISGVGLLGFWWVRFRGKTDADDVSTFS